MPRKRKWKVLSEKEEKARKYWNATSFILMRLDQEFFEDIAYEVDLKYGIPFDEALILVQVLKELKELFPKKSESWFKRSAVRALFVVRKNDNWWLVPGFLSLGDEYSIYSVLYDKKEKKYTCDCFYHFYGEVRKAKICTHIGAVMVYRRLQRKLSEFMF